MIPPIHGAADPVAELRAAIMGIFAQNDAIKYSLYGTALLCLAIASFRVWKDERVRRISAEFQVAELTAERKAIYVGPNTRSSALDICVVFEDRDDGGLRVYSDDVPGFVLSHSDRDAVMADMIPVMETIIGEMMKHPVKVVPSASPRSLPWFSESKRETREYRAVWAA